MTDASPETVSSMHLIDMETPPPSSEDVDTYDDRLNVTDASPEPVSSMSLVDMETPPPSDDENIELKEPEHDHLHALLDLDPDNSEDMKKLERERGTIWGKVEVFLKHQKLFRRKYKFRCWTSEAYPLGMLFALRAPLELIQKSYGVFPDAGIPSLHLALCYNAGLKTVEWLLDEIPDAVKVPCQDGRVALHFACRSAPASLPLVRAVYNTFPDAIYVKDPNGRTPLHLAFEWSSIPVINFLISNIDAPALESEDCDEDTPLHSGCFNTDVNVRRYVFEQYPGFLRKSRRSDGWLPLHLVCDQSECWHPVQLLLEHYPEAAQQKDVNGELPLALAQRNIHFSSDLSRIKMLEVLVGAYPESIAAVDNDGNPTLDEETKDALLKYMASQLQEHRAKKQRTAL